MRALAVPCPLPLPSVAEGDVHAERRRFVGLRRPPRAGVHPAATLSRPSKAERWLLRPELARDGARHVRPSWSGLRTSAGKPESIAAEVNAPCSRSADDPRSRPDAPVRAPG